MAYNALTISSSFSQLYVGDVALVDFVKRGNDGLRNPFFKKPFYFQNGVIAQFYISSVFTRFKCSKARFNRVFNLLFLRTPLKVSHAVVLFVSVFVVYGRLIFGVWNKRLSNNPVQKALFKNAILTKGDTMVSKRYFSRGKRLWIKTALTTPLDRKHFSVWRCSVKRFITADWLGVTWQFTNPIMLHGLTCNNNLN